ncbi:hypothetical protein DPMN_155341 [Dreissena polymorpha]|uniref:Uncharacterized protein n=1 Tax=Dreissena polymorpha TaxID=45954 RepID=A0A9D4JB97_DREPO|nr:hypothetical protein DPMN_155341 [Dreissena polymorpha]
MPFQRQLLRPRSLSMFNQPRITSQHHPVSIMLLLGSQIHGTIKRKCWKLPTPELLLNEAELIELVTSGQYPCTVDPVTGNLEVSLQLFNGQSVQQSEERRPSVNDWSVVVDQEFALPTSERTLEKPNARKLTSHRILTYEEIVEKKQGEKRKARTRKRKSEIG